MKLHSLSTLKDRGFPDGSVVKNLPANAADAGSIPGLGRSPGERNGNPLQYSCLEKSMDGEAWQAIVHGVAKGQTRLSDFTFTFSFMDLTFQVPVQYCSLQHQTLLPSAVTSTTGCCFCFGSIPSFFLELFSTDLQQCTGHLLTWGVHLSVSYLFAFSYCSWGSQGKNMKWLAIPFSSGPRFVRPLHHDVLGGAIQHGSQFH